MYIYRVRFKGKGDVIGESQEDALQKIEKQLDAFDMDYIDIAGSDKAIRTDDVYEEMEYLYRLTKTEYEFNARNTDYTDYSKGYDKGYLKGMEAMLEQMKGILYGNENDKVGR